MYAIEDFIYYENMGICQVTDISMQRIAGESQLYYTLQPLHESCVVYTPVGSDKVFTRPVISKGEAERLIDTIPSIQAEPYHNSILGRLAEHYTAALKTHDCANLIELTMSIYAKKEELEGQNRKFGAIDEKFMKLAEDLLFDELSVALDISRDEVTTYIESRVDQLAKTQVR